MRLYLKYRDSYDDYRFPIYIIDSTERTQCDKYLICHSAERDMQDTPDTENVTYRIKFDKSTCKVSNTIEDLADMIYVYNDWTGESGVFPAKDIRKAKDLYNKWYAELRDKEVEDSYCVILHYCVKTRRCLYFISQYDSRYDEYL